MPPDCYPGRLGFLLTTFLVLVNMFMGVLYAVPMTDGINFMAMWLLSCILFVFAALLEYAIILNYKNTRKSNKSQDVLKTPPKTKPKDAILLLDSYSRICFPVTFFIFIIFFIFYKIKQTTES